MRYRTDLAIECMEELEAAAENEAVYRELNTPKGIEIDKDIYDDIKVTRIKIVNEDGEKLFSKQKGNYITLEIDGIAEEQDGIKARAACALARELSKLVNVTSGFSALVVGLGNDDVTPDALGPQAAAKVKATRHLTDIYGTAYESQVSSVSCFIPGVTGATGIETADIIKKAADIVKPDAVIIIDSLAARNIKRVNTTLQMNDIGISPGSGMGNVRKELNRETLGCTVIAIGVPTVIDAETLIIDALYGTNMNDKEIDDYLKNNPQELVVTSTDIDAVIKEFSEIIANGINITLHPGIYS